MEKLRQEILNQKYISIQISNSSYQNSNSIIDSIIYKSIRKIGEHAISKKYKKREKKYTVEFYH